MSALKPGSNEAKRLAAFIARVARPRTPDEASECEHWLRRLEGPRS